MSFLTEKEGPPCADAVEWKSNPAIIKLHKVRNNAQCVLKQCQVMPLQCAGFPQVRYSLET